MKTILATALFFAAATTSAVDFQVAPNGNDANAGTADKPLASLRGVREMRSEP